MDHIYNHLKMRDPKLYLYIKKIGKLEPIQKESPNTYFFCLCREIIGQQLSNKASSAIVVRFLSFFKKKKPNPDTISQLSIEQLRTIGISYAKAAYIKNIASAVLENKIDLYKLDGLSDEKVIEQLTAIKGIGPWTAEMFLMFVLGRENVFSFGDLGLKKGIKKIYGLKKDPTKKQMEKMTAKWSPYKTFASRILWKSLDIG